MDTIQKARTLMNRRLEDLSRERMQLETALSHLTDRSLLRAGSGGSGNGGRSRPRARRGQRELEFLAAVKARPGSRMTEIAREIGVKPQQLYPIARRLSESGAVKKSGRGYEVTRR